MGFVSGLACTLSAAAHLVIGIAHTRLSPSWRASQVHHRAFYRELWTSAAAEVGAAVRAEPGGRGLQVHLPGRVLRVDGSQCSIDAAEVLARAGDKELVSRLLREAGLPVPRHLAFSPATLAEADAFRVAAPGACVVKPAKDTAAGRGVTTGVRSVRDLRRAAAAAAAAGARGTGAASSSGPVRRAVALLRGLRTVRLLIEHEVTGANYRLLYLDGVLLDAIRRDPPTVIGDGARTVAELIQALNGTRVRTGGGHGQTLVTRDLDLERTLARQGIDLRSVPAAGIEVRLKTTINENAPDSNHPVLDVLCPEIIAQGRLAAEVVGARLAGVDMLTSDPSVPLQESGGCVLEVNTTPGLAMHYHGHEGAAAPATSMLRRLAAGESEVAR